MARTSTKTAENAAAKNENQNPAPGADNQTPPAGNDQAGTPPADTAENAAAMVDDGLPKYTKDQLLKSSTYSHRRDVLTALLDEKQTYSHGQVAAIMKEFYEKPIKKAVKK